VDVIYGSNKTCPHLEEIAVRDTINEALTNMNITESGGLLQEVNGDICIDDGDSIDDDKMNRSLIKIQKYTWNGRMSKFQQSFVTSLPLHKLTSFQWQRVAYAPLTKSSEGAEDSTH
jgi:hypothetical protein